MLVSAELCMSALLALSVGGDDERLPYGGSPPVGFLLRCSFYNCHHKRIHFDFVKLIPVGLLTNLYAKSPIGWYSTENIPYRQLSTS